MSPRWTWVPVDPAPCCGARPSKRSTARCEMPVNHEGVKVAADWHAGRTRGGYWKFWPAPGMSDLEPDLLIWRQVEATGHLGCGSWSYDSRDEPGTVTCCCTAVIPLATTAAGSQVPAHEPSGLPLPGGTWYGGNAEHNPTAGQWQPAGGAL